MEQPVFDMNEIGKYLPLVLIPLVLIGFKDKGKDLNLEGLSNLSVNTDFDSRVKMLRGIKNYFEQEDQVLLSKVEDIFDILNKLQRLNLGTYEDTVMGVSMDSSLSAVDRMERILTEMVDYMAEDKKKMVDKVLETKGRIDATQSNLTTHKKILMAGKTNKLDEWMHFLKCFEPLLQGSLKQNIKKLETIIDVLRSPE